MFSEDQEHPCSMSGNEPVFCDLSCLIEAGEKVLPCPGPMASSKSIKSFSLLALSVASPLETTAVAWVGFFFPSGGCAAVGCTPVPCAVEGPPARHEHPARCGTALRPCLITRRRVPRVRQRAGPLRVACPVLRSVLQRRAAKWSFSQAGSGKFS